MEEVDHVARDSDDILGEGKQEHQVDGYSTTTSTAINNNTITTTTTIKKPVSPSNSFSAKHKSAYISILHNKLMTITQHLEKFDIAIALLKTNAAKQAADAARKQENERHQHHVKQSTGKTKRSKRGKKENEMMSELKRSQECVIKIFIRRQEREVTPLKPTPKIPQALIKSRPSPTSKKQQPEKRRRNIKDAGKAKMNVKADKEVKERVVKNDDIKNLDSSKISNNDNDKNIKKNKNSNTSSSVNKIKVNEEEPFNGTTDITVGQNTPATKTVSNPERAMDNVNMKNDSEDSNSNDNKNTKTNEKISELSGNVFDTQIPGQADNIILGEKLGSSLVTKLNDNMHKNDTDMSQSSKDSPNKVEVAKEAGNSTQRNNEDKSENKTLAEVAVANRNKINKGANNKKSNEEMFFSTEMPTSSIINPTAAIFVSTTTTPEPTEVRRSNSNGNWDVWNGVEASVSPNFRTFAPSPSPSPTLSNISQSSPKTSVNHSEGKKLLPNNLSGLLVGAVLQSLRQGPKSTADLRRSISSTVAWKGPANILYHQVEDILSIFEALGIAVPSTMSVPKLQRERIESFSFSPDDLASASRRRSSAAHYCPSPFFARPGPPRPTTASGEVLSTERIMNIDQIKMEKKQAEEDKVRIKVADLAAKTAMKRNRSASQDAMEYAAAKAGSSAGANAASGICGDVKLSGTFAEAANAVDKEQEKDGLKILPGSKADDRNVSDTTATTERSDTQDSNSGFLNMLNNNGTVLSSDLSKNINNMVRPTQERKMAQAKRAWHLEIIKLIRIGAYREIERRYGPKGLQSAIDYVKAERYPITISTSSNEKNGRKKPFYVHPKIPKEAQVMAKQKNFIGIRGEWGNAVARNSYKWAWRNNLFYGTGEPLPGDARALARVGEFELIESEWGIDGRTCAINWIGKQSELWLLEEEPQLMEIDAAQDMVLGEYDRLVNDLINLKNRRSYMRQQLSILARNSLNGGESIDGSTCNTDDLLKIYKSNNETSSNNASSSDIEKNVSLVVNDIIDSVLKWSLPKKKPSVNNTKFVTKFRNDNKVQKLRSQIEHIYQCTRALKVVSEKNPVSGYEDFPKAVDFHGPSLSLQNKVKLREIQSRFNVKFDDDLATYYGGMGESASSAFYGGGRRGLSSPLPSPSPSPTNVSKRPASSSKKPASASKKPASASKKPTSVSKKPPSVGKKKKRPPPTALLSKKKKVKVKVPPPRVSPTAIKRGRGRPKKISSSTTPNAGSQIKSSKNKLHPRPKQSPKSSPRQSPKLSPQQLLRQQVRQQLRQQPRKSPLQSPRQLPKPKPRIIKRRKPLPPGCSFVCTAVGNANASGVKRKGRFGRGADPAQSPALLVTPVQNPDHDMNALALASKQLASSSSASSSHRGGVRNIRGSPTLVEIYDNTNLQSDPINWSSISIMFEPVAVKESQLLQSPTKKRRQSKTPKGKPKGKQNVKSGASGNNINGDVSKKSKMTKKILFVPRWHKVTEVNNVVTDQEDGVNSIKADDEVVSDEVYASRHTKHLEQMRIEFEEKKKLQERLKEQKKLERLKQQSLGANRRR